jgi:hypothetical protein
MNMYARLNENNVVINVEVADPEWVNSQPNPSFYVQATENNKPAIGGDYFNGLFYPIKPFESWLRDGQGNWIAPVENTLNLPTCFWNEETLTWIQHIPEQ